MRKLALVFVLVLVFFLGLGKGVATVYAGGCGGASGGIGCYTDSWGYEHCPGGTGEYDPQIGQSCCQAQTNSSCEDGPPSCFVPGTKVTLADEVAETRLRQGYGGRSINIEDVKIGDRVKTFEDDKILESTVVNTLKSRRDFYYSLEAGDYNVKVAAEHRFYIGGGNFEEVQNLQVGDSVYVDTNNALVAKTVTAKTRIDQPTDVYNLTIDKTHTYFANDFAVHNIKCLCPGLQEVCSGNPEVCKSKCMVPEE